MPNPWFRMYTDFLEDPKMLALAFEDQRHFIGVLALKSAGTLDQECAPKIMDRLVAQRLWIDHSAVNEVKRRLMDSGLIDEDWQPIAWEKRQFVSDHDPSAAERARRYREKKRAEAEKEASRVTSRTRHAARTDTEQIQNRTEQKEMGTKAKRFRPPTAEEVAVYCRERGNSVNPEKFIDHYTGNGWMRGKTKMKDWKAVIRTWEQNEDETRKRNGNSTRAGQFADAVRRYADDAEEVDSGTVSENAGGLRPPLDGQFSRH